MKSVRKRLTYANVMSSIAVFFVVAGGSAIAAGSLGKNSVGSKQLKKNAVTAAKIKNEAVTGAKIKKGTITSTNLDLAGLGQVPSAAKADFATNAGHATSADNANHASSADTATKANLATQANTATNTTNLPAVLASGQTLRGDVSDAIDTNNGEISAANVSFAVPLAAPPTVHIINPGETPPAGCSGSVEQPNAEPGNLCIFIGLKEGVAGAFLTIDPENVLASQPAAGKFGFFIYNNATGTGRDQWWGSWAVTG